MNMVLNILDYLLSIVSTIIIVQFVMSILIAFNVINTHNDFVNGIWQALEKLTEPLYRPIRKILPDLGPIDFSPMVVLILINILQRFVLPALYQPQLVYPA
jgi:YggT family protein